MGLESRKEMSYAFEELGENVFTRCDTLGRLSDTRCKKDPPRETDGILAERKTPMPAKITLAGENTCKTYFRNLQ